MACGGSFIGRSQRRPRNSNQPFRTRPAYGTIGNEPQAIGPAPSVTRSSRPSTTKDASRPPASRSTTASTPGGGQDAASARIRARRRAARDHPACRTVIVPPPAPATGRIGVPLATSSLAGGVVRKICWSIPATMPADDVADRSSLPGHQAAADRQRARPGAGRARRIPSAANPAMIAIQPAATNAAA